MPKNFKNMKFKYISQYAAKKGFFPEDFAIFSQCNQYIPILPATLIVMREQGMKDYEYNIIRANCLLLLQGQC